VIQGSLIHGVSAATRAPNHCRVPGESAHRDLQSQRLSGDHIERAHNISLQRPVTIKCSSRGVGRWAAELGR
jgi:hypothetical protein